MEHLPVMLNEVLQHLVVDSGGIYLDCTYGRGGHSRAIMRLLSTEGRLLALDRDLEAIHSVSAEELSQDSRFSLIHAPFSDLTRVVVNEGLLGKVSGVLLDLGVSSPQLDNPQRGFSFLQDGPLDMRMDDSVGMRAEQWLAQVEEKKLAEVLFKYGEERFARRIARVIVEKRSISPIVSTSDLVDLITEAIPYRERHKHPATRCFQAIRIEINNELQELQSVLPQILQILRSGGRLVVISFHSLEDRIVKRFINHESSGAGQSVGRLPIKESEIEKGVLKKIGKAMKAGASEIVSNSRSRSAVMRVAEKI